MRFFNTAGPCDPRFHYMLPAVERLEDAPMLVSQGGYFVVHAPRQTGKTTSLAAFAKQLTGAGEYAALYFSCEVGQSLGDDVVAVQRALLDAITIAADDNLPAPLRPPAPWPERGAEMQLSVGLRGWARQCPRRLVLIFDEIDALRGMGLLNVLSQLRANYQHRPDNAPWSVILCGLRDVRDYKARSGGNPDRLGSASPFNIKVKSMRLGDFTADEIATLYAQHSAETGQSFTDQAVARAFELTAGQPWLVNSLAREIIYEMQIAPPETITVEHVNQAKERLILTRATHLDSLVARLHEPRVRRIIEPLMAGSMAASSTYSDDVSYVRDLGLVAQGRRLMVANPIYREVMVRVLAEQIEEQIPVSTRAFVDADGRLNMRAMLTEFGAFWREHGEILTGAMIYHEVAPQLVLMAFLQRVVNGGGFIDREYGVGRGRIDLLVRWPVISGANDTANDMANDIERPVWQREAVEIKVWRDKKPDPRERGLAQLDSYLDTLDLPGGTLVLFDRRQHHDQGIEITDDVTPTGRPVLLMRA